MSLASKMDERKKAAALREATKKQLYKNEREYRAAKAIDSWSKIAKIGAGLKQMNLHEAQNVALNLTQQATYMSKLNEAQLSQSFSDFAPENMLRLVRLAMPGVCRNKVFTEFAMESAKDSIKYIKPVFSKTHINGLDLNDKHTLYGRDGDPWGYNKGEDVYNSQNVSEDEIRKAMYETTEDRATGELVNYPYGKVEGTKVTFGFEIPESAGANYASLEKAAKWKNGKALIRGYTTVYGADERDVIAVEEKRTHTFLYGKDYAGKVTVEYKSDKENELIVTFASADDMPEAVSALARVDLEDDFEGDSLGEVELVLTDFDFKPRPTTIGVTWSQLAEITLDASFGVSTQELLVQYAAEAIRVNLDYRAFKLAYYAAKTNSDAHFVVFDAAYNNNGVGTKEGYIHNAQTFTTAIDTLSDNMLNEINRGGVSRMVTGPSAGSYLKLCVGQFSTKGVQPNIGIHQIGEFESIPTFKAPSAIIPSDEILCVWKNDQNEGDVAIAFGTLVPFVNTGVIQRKQFYKEAGIASYGDWACLNRRYLGIIKIINMKDVTQDLKVAATTSNGAVTTGTTTETSEKDGE